MLPKCEINVKLLAKRDNVDYAKEGVDLLNGGKMYKLLLIVAVLTTTGCTGGKIVDVKSPCASLGEPCGPRQPINDWWLREEGLIGFNTVEFTRK